MDKIQNFIIIVLALIIFIMGVNNCNNELSASGEAVTKIDSFFVAGKSDTVFFPGKVRRFVDSFPVLVEIEIERETKDTINTYLTELQDSLISGTIKSKVKGQLIATEINYTPKFPKYITRVDTIRINKEITKPANNYGLYFGVIVGAGPSSLAASPSLMLKTKKDFVFTGGYDLINKAVTVGAFTPIRWPKPF